MVCFSRWELLGMYGLGNDNLILGIVRNLFQEVGGGVISETMITLETSSEKMETLELAACIPFIIV